jgi:chemotaxis protein CheD
MSERIKVGMARWEIGRGEDVLISFGLGSCVALGLYDAQSQTAAMAHIMLPDSKQFHYRKEANQAKYADTALLAMLEHFQSLGIARQRLRAKLVGGANMFIFPVRDGGQEGLNIGKRNIEAVKVELIKAGIPVTAEDVGGLLGRSIEFFAKNGKIKIRTALSGENEI